MKYIRFLLVFLVISALTGIAVLLLPSGSVQAEVSLARFLQILELEDKLVALTDDRSGTVSSLHNHSFDDIKNPEGDIKCSDLNDIPKHGSGELQLSGVSDGWCDGDSTFKNGSHLYTLDGNQSFSWQKTCNADTGPAACVYENRELIVESTYTGQSVEAMRIELSMESTSVVRSKVLKLIRTPSPAHLEGHDILILRVEESEGGQNRALRVSHSKEADSHITTALFVAHPYILDALDMGQNNVVTSCYDRFDTGTPQISCAGQYSENHPYGCPDTFCDFDGSTNWPNKQTFPATDFETIFNGASVDNADAQHMHTRTKSFSLIAPSTGDSAKVQWAPAKAITIVKVWCSTDAGTVTIMPDERVEATPNTQGTDLLSAALVCATISRSSCASGCDVDTISNGSIDAYDPVSLDIDAVSTATAVRVHYEYTMTGA